MTATFYNDNDPDCCRTLRYQISIGARPAGDVIEKSIKDLDPAEFMGRGYRHHHLFAGFGGWGLAMQLAGFPLDVSLVTASWPCQPHSVAGKRGGSADKRHLWPEVARILCAIEPEWFLGENVPGLRSSGDGLNFGGVVGDLAEMGYRVGWASFSASDVGNPHKRERVFFMAYRSEREGSPESPRRCERESRVECVSGAERDVADADCRGWDGGTGQSGARGRGKLADINPLGNADRFHGHDGGSDSSGVCRERSESTLVPRGENVGNTDRQRESQCSGMFADGRGWTGDTSSGDVVHTHGRERVRSENEICSRRNTFDHAGFSGSAFAGLGRAVDGLPAWLDGRRHVAHRGDDPNEWEAPRVTTQTRNRRKRLKMLGNGLDLYQVTLFVSAVVAAMADTEGRGLK